METASKFLGSASKATIYSQLTFNFIGKFIIRLFRKVVLSELFSMLNFLQLIVFIPLVKIKFPANSLPIFGSLNEAATFDMLYTDNWFPIVFNFGEFEPFNQEFEAQNMETTVLIMNLGTLFVVLIVNIINYISYGVGKLLINKCCCKDKLRNLLAKQKDELFYSTMVDYIGPSYIEIAFAVILNY